ADALAELQGDALRCLRRDIRHLFVLYERHPRDDRDVVGALQRLSDRLPPESEAEHLQALAQLRRWDFADGKLQTQIEDSVRELASDQRRAALDMLEQKLPAAWELGHAF